RTRPRALRRCCARCAALFPHSLLPLLAASPPGRSGHVRCSAGYPPPYAHSLLLLEIVVEAIEPAFPAPFQLLHPPGCFVDAAALELAAPDSAGLGGAHDSRLLERLHVFQHCTQ